MTVRNVSGTYALSDGTMLPGYNQESSILGFNSSFNAPLGGFVFGQQRYDIWGKETGYNIATTAASNGWLVKNQDLNKQFTMTHSQNLNLRASLEPLKDLTVELTVTRTYGNNSSEFYRWNEDSQQFEGQSRVETGTLTYSNISIGSAFTKLGARDYQSETFTKLLANRVLVSELLGANNPSSNPLVSGYYAGYSGTQQEVITGAFLTAFSNRGMSEKNINPVKNMPLPNWSINYNGLTKMAFAKKYVKNFVIRHAYSSTVSVSGLQTNLNAEFDQNGNASALDINNNFIADRQIQNVTISERFSPLIGIDATWTIKGQGLITKFEYKKDRSATLSLNNNQITEILGNEWIIGTGYKFAKVKLPFEKIPASALNLRFDFSFRDNLTVIRKVVENTNQATAGQRVISIKTSADYNMTQNLTVQFYYDQVINTPKIATSFPTGNMSTGIRLRFNLAGVQ
jgi:cell surface protein SprA